MSKFLPFKGVRPNPSLLPELVQSQFDQVIYNETRYDFTKEQIAEECLKKGFDESISDDLKYFVHIGMGFKKLIEKSYFSIDKKPSYYMFGVNWYGEWLYGLVGAVHYNEYWSGTIKKHEHTLEHNEAELVKITNAIDFNFNPIFLTYDGKPLINAFIEREAQEKEAYKYLNSNGLEHRMWVIDSDEKVEELRQLFKSVDVAYIADGHHRIESGSIIAKERNHKSKEVDNNAPHNYFISTYFSTQHLKMFEFNRMLSSFNGVDEEDFWSRLHNLYNVIKVGNQPVRPNEKRTFGMYYKKTWYKLYLKELDFLDDDPVMNLDVSILKYRLLKPIFGLDNFRNNKIINYADGTRPIQELIDKVDHGEMKIAFTLCPPDVNEMITIADLELTMPPKATCMEPKIKSGLIARLLS